jgi:hypothetical protein
MLELRIKIKQYYYALYVLKVSNIKLLNNFLIVKF